MHGIVGENGAGKSTLLKMLFGFYQPNSGELIVNGVSLSFAGPSDCNGCGYRDGCTSILCWLKPFTVLENIILGAEGQSMLNHAMADARAKLLGLEQQFGFNLPLDTEVSKLSVGERQRVEILKALYRGADILILDEPTAVLTPQECDQLFELVGQLKERGKTILFVTHKLHEIMAITDAVTVIRAGKVVVRTATADTSPDNLAGSDGWSENQPRSRTPLANSMVRRGIEVKAISALSDHGHRALKNVSFDLFDGEVLGVAGVAGNGQTELLEVLTGLRAVSEGEVSLNGQAVNQPDHQVDPIALREMGLSHIAEDRLKTGVVASMTATENAILGYQREKDFSRSGLLRLKDIGDAAKRYFESQDVRPRDPSLPVASFSGGNQQKLVIAREIARDPQTLIIGQPTRGVDIGAVTKIHDQITELRNAGKALLVVSADLDELMAISDRIIVMCEGEITGELAISDADERTIGLMMAGAMSTTQEAGAVT